MSKAATASLTYTGLFVTTLLLATGGCPVQQGADRTGAARVGASSDTSAGTSTNNIDTPDAPPLPAVQPRITVALPALYSNLETATLERIQWSSEGTIAPRWSVFLLRGDPVKSSEQLVIAAAQSADGVWYADWFVPVRLQSSGDYSLLIREDHTGIEAQSGFFSIQSPARWIAVAEPSVAQSVSLGGQVTVRWTGHAIRYPEWHLYLVKRGVTLGELAVTPSASGGDEMWAAVWTCPALLDPHQGVAAGDDFVILVVDEITRTRASSARFAITE